MNHGVAGRAYLKRFYRALLDAVFPAKCLACGSFFRPGLPGVQDLSKRSRFEISLGGYLCASCLAACRPVQSPMCPVCGLMFESRQGEDHLCGSCISHVPVFGKARACGVYEKSFRSLIHLLKYRSRMQLVRPFSELLLETFQRHWAENEVDLAVPVPLHSKRLRQRGFNQAFVLVRTWKRQLGLDIDESALKRVRMTAPQTGLGKKSRLENLKGAFAVGNANRISGKRVLLIDDVYTTGTTADACVGALLKAGAGRVDVLTLARTP